MRVSRLELCRRNVRHTEQLESVGLLKARFLSILIPAAEGSAVGHQLFRGEEQTLGLQQLLLLQAL